MPYCRATTIATGLAILLALLAGCIRIETGQTLEEAVASSEVRAGQIRSQWANRLNAATPREMADMLLDHARDVTDRYLAYGADVASRWREGSVERGKDISASEMREFVAAWIEVEKPLLTAWEENLEYGLERIVESGFYDETSRNLFQHLVDRYYDVYSMVFFPSSTAEDYEAKLYQVRFERDRAIEDLENEIAKY